MTDLPYDDMARVLTVLANRTRLEILDTLRVPARLGEIRVMAAEAGSWGRDARPISRQAVRRHIDALLEIGAIDRLESDDGDVRYVTDHARLHALTSRLRVLSTLRPEQQLEQETQILGDETTTTAPSGPHVVVIRGVDEGRVVTLPRNEDGAIWVTGRDRACDVPLEHDTYASSHHAQIQQKDGRFYLIDLATNRNGTRLNWAQLGKGAVAPLDRGDVIGVGETLLLFRY